MKPRIVRNTPHRPPEKVPPKGGRAASVARTANVACIVGNVVGIATVTCLAAGLFPSDLDDTCRAPRSPQDALAGMEDLYSTYGLGVLIGLAPYIVLGAFTLVARISPALGETKRESRRRTVAVRWMSG